MYSLVEGLSERLSLHSRNQSHHQKGNGHELVTLPGVVDCQTTDQSAQLVYYIAFVVIFQFGWAATQISHLSMIPVMTRFSHSLNLFQFPVCKKIIESKSMTQCRANTILFHPSNPLISISDP